MTKEEENLLIKDLCARLPYGVKCKLIYNNKAIKDENATLFGIDKYGSFLFAEFGEDTRKFVCKPYLFPMSSMTKEIMEEIYNNTGIYDIGINFPVHIEVGTTFEDLTKIIDILHEHHFDWRGLIPMGLANDATGLNIY